MKKYVSILFALLVIVSALAGCAGQSGTPADSFSEEDYQKLLALQFDDYRHMTISEFQNRIWKMTDTPEYMALLERFFKDETLYRMKDSDETAWFLFYILEPLTAQNWQTQNYSGVAESDLPAPAENARLEYNYTLTLLAADKVMVKDYNDMRLGVPDMMWSILKNRTKEELQNETFMQKELKSYIDGILPYLQTPEVSIAIDYAYFPLPAEDENHAHAYFDSGAEQRRIPNGTEEDYRSLLALKTDDYANSSIADFNAALLAWANEDFDRMERIDTDTQWNDFPAALTDEERAFVCLTVFLSGTENGKLVQSYYTGEPPADPFYQQHLPQRETNCEEAVWCDLSYSFSYHIADEQTLTVGERDQRVSSLICAIQKFWDETALESLRTMTESDIAARLTALAAEYSSDAFILTIPTEQIHFEHAECAPC